MIKAKLSKIIEQYRQRLLVNDAKAMATACYVACYSDPIMHLDDAPILSFAWILADYLQPPTANVSFVKQLGTQMIEWLERDLKGSDHVSAHLERFQFCNLLRDNLFKKLGRPVELHLSGSSALGLTCPVSNLDLHIDGVEFEELLAAVKELFPTAVASSSSTIEYRGQPYAFTLQTGPTMIDDVAGMIRTSFDTNPSIYMVCLLLMRWARANHLVRRNSHHVGRLTVTSLCLQILNQFNDVGGGFRLPTPEEEMNRMERILEGPFDVDYVGDMIMEIFNRLARSGSIEVLCEQAHRAIHLLAQSATLSSLWELEPNVANSNNFLGEDLAAARRRPRLLRRPISHGGKNGAPTVTSASYFMEGASLLLLGGCQSDVDTVMFDLYQGRRRPQHADAQCYLPLIVNKTMVDGGEAHVFSTFLTHAYRQIDLARRQGSVEFGPLKLSIKFGHFYLTNLPRLFMEEGMAATMQTVRKALNLGYSVLSEGKSEQLMQAEGGAMVFEPLKPEPEDEQESEASGSSSASSSKNSPSKPTVVTTAPEDARAMKPQVKKKTSLTPLSSSFEPTWHRDDGGIEKLLELLAFEPSASVQKGYAVSLCLFNRATNLSHGIQVIYDEEMKFLRASHRPIRWMSVDLRSTANSSVNFDPCLVPLMTPAALDLRMVISSSRPIVDLDEDSVLAEQLREGIVQVEGEQELRVQEAFRSNPTIFCRHVVTYKWHPTAQSVHAWHRLGLPTLPSSSLLPSIQCSQVTEYSSPSPLTGLFEFHPQEKDEVEMIIPLEWSNLSDCGADFIGGVWRIAQTMRMFI